MLLNFNLLYYVSELKRLKKYKSVGILSETIRLLVISRQIVQFVKKSLVISELFSLKILTVAKYISSGPFRPSEW